MENPKIGDAAHAASDKCYDAVLSGPRRPRSALLGGREPLLVSRHCSMLLPKDPGHELTIRKQVLMDAQEQPIFVRNRLLGPTIHFVLTSHAAKSARRSSPGITPEIDPPFASCP